ncbi:unnamed protein product [Linum tenue]|uniref:OTU domain-containing protein n=1 Tax=Linum tenue TaxID=586396 RepID=A0AAV0MAU1_9ROSI|nr:unnamed protein product [Linum tenue]
MDEYSVAGVELYPYHLHRFWSSLVYESPPDRAEWEDHDAIERNIFTAMVEDVYKQGPAAIRKATQILRPHIHPQVEGLQEPRESEAQRGRPPKRANARDPSSFEHERARAEKRSKTNQSPRTPRSKTNQSPRTPRSKTPTGARKSQHMQVHNERNVCPYLRYVPPSIHPLVRGWFDPEPDGQCGFRAMSHAIHGDEGHYLQMRQDIITEVRNNWDLYKRVYLSRDGSLEAVVHRLDCRIAGRCTQEYWFEEADLLVFATMYNWAIIVYGLYGGRHTYGYTALPLTALEGVTQPSAVMALVFTGAHWVRLIVDDVDGVTPMPPFSPQWSHFRNMTSIPDWDLLYEQEQALYAILGGHYPNDDEESD